MFEQIRLEGKLCVREVLIEPADGAGRLMLWVQRAEKYAPFWMASRSVAWADLGNPESRKILIGQLTCAALWHGCHESQHQLTGQCPVPDVTTCTLIDPDYLAAEEEYVARLEYEEGEFERSFGLAQPETADLPPTVVAWTGKSEQNYGADGHEHFGRAEEEYDDAIENEPLRLLDDEDYQEPEFDDSDKPASRFNGIGNDSDANWWEYAKDHWVNPDFSLR